MPEVIINGPEGRIEGRYHHARGGTAPMALVLHPHPLHGGTMNNKIVYTLYQSFVRRGFSTLRFNFRGVGRSQGSFDRGEGELADAAAALDWLQGYNPNAVTCWVAGYSFGAWIGMQLLMRRPEIDAFISVSPPANQYDFSFLAPCPSSGLILQGDQDNLVPHESVQKLVHKLSHQRDIKIDYRKIPGADHFFMESAETLATHVDAYIETHARVGERAAPATAGRSRYRFARLGEAGMRRDVSIDMPGHRLGAFGEEVVGTRDLAEIDLDVALVRELVDQLLHRLCRHQGVLVALQDQPRRRARREKGEVILIGRRRD